MVCYNLNGRESPFDDKTHVPCNMTAVNSGGHSICCPIGDYCLTNGMCKNNGSKNDNWYWRTACTDPEWKDPACPRYCEPIEPKRNTGLIFSCFAKNEWCCAYVGEKGLRGWSSRSSFNTTCCTINDLKFTAEEPIIYATAKVPNNLSILPTVMGSSTTHFSTISQDTSASVTDIDFADLPTEDSSPTYEVASSQHASSSELSIGAKVGLGVGIPVGLLALAAIGAFVWTRRKKQSTIVNNLPEAYVPTDNKNTAVNQHGAEMYRYELPPQVVAAELPAHVEPHQLPEQTAPAP